MIEIIPAYVKKTVLAAGILAMLLAFRNNDPLEESIQRGKTIYASYCLTCHQPNGAGITGVFPPLAKSDYLMADKKRSIRQVLYGVEGEMVVNGIKYNTPMTGFALSNQEAADVLNYVRNSWGNEGEIVTPEEVAKVKSANK